MHTNGYDEALSLPTEEAARIALRTQQIVAFESGAADTVDPLAGSYYVEALTQEVEEAAWQLIRHIDDMGGSVSAIEQGFIQEEIARSAYQYQQRVEKKSRSSSASTAIRPRRPDLSPYSASTTASGRCRRQNSIP
ncbi:methylmalonyl-CoA mutase family protein [Puia sp. P3]|uniref:methylmalonyl-CoA mutase family protein n=1 Tax=Puia sp. P3 TaxID=3423952 RepID=UPI003D66E18A